MAWGVRNALLLMLLAGSAFIVAGRHDARLATEEEVAV